MQNPVGGAIGAPYPHPRHWRLASKRERREHVRGARRGAHAGGFSVSVSVELFATAVTSPLITDWLPYGPKTVIWN